MDLYSPNRRFRPPSPPPRHPLHRPHRRLSTWLLDEPGFQVSIGADRDLDHRKPDRPAPLRKRPVLRRCSPESLSLARPHRFQRRAERIACSRLDLDDDEVLAAPAYQVELTAPGQEPRTHDLIAERTEQFRRGSLAGAT